MTTIGQKHRAMRFVPTTLVALAALASGCADRAPSAGPEPTPAPAGEPPASPTPTVATPPPLPASPPPVAPPPAEPPALPEGPTEHRTAMRAEAYAEPRIEAPKLVTVFWVNEDSVTHSVVSTDGGFAGSGPIPPGGEFSRTFLTAGEFPYYCRYHGNMAGVLVVR